jgi:MYXO-CTERM domain-containing protein
VFALPLGSAHATMIVQSASFSTVGGSTFIQFPGFDPALGTLQSVDVQFSGFLSFEVLVLPGETVAPVVQFDAFGAGSTGFDFSGSGALFMFDAVSNPPPAELDPGTPFLMRYATFFTLNFTVNHWTDFTGVVVPDAHASGVGVLPPALVDAHRSDFIPPFVPVGILDPLIFAPWNFTPLGGVNAAGVVLLTYDYVDLHANPVTNVSAPPSLGMFVLALLALWRRRRTVARPA